MSQIVLKHATALLETGFRPVDILVDGPYIAQIAPELTVPAGAQVIECAGKLVIPGLIDAHVHFRQPGMEQKATIASESR